METPTTDYASPDEVLIVSELPAPSEPPPRPGGCPTGPTARTLGGMAFTLGDVEVPVAPWGPRVSALPCELASSDRYRPAEDVRAARSHLGLRIARARPAPRLSVDILRRRLSYNQGAFSRCFHRVGSGGVKSRVDLAFTILSNGVVEGVEPKGTARDTPELTGCLQSALGELRFPAFPRGDVEVSLTFVGVKTAEVPSLPARATAREVMAGALAALRAGDGETAARRFAALEQESPSCDSAIGRLQALMSARPWYDAPVDDAAVALLGQKPTGFCLERALPILVELARVPLEESGSLRSSKPVEVAIARLERLAEVNDERTRREARDRLSEARESLAIFREEERQTLDSSRR